MDNTIQEIDRDQVLIEVYDKLGHKHFSKGSDVTLKKWGNSDDLIRKIKIQSVECELNFNRKGIETYKILNELLGGQNQELQ